MNITTTNPSLKTYHRLWCMGAPVYRLYLWWRIWRGIEDKQRQSERFGLYDHPPHLPPHPNKPHPNRSGKGKLIWLHAVSVGESRAALALAENILTQARTANRLQILITTNTVSAAQLIARHAHPAICHAFQPADHAAWVDRFLDYWQPDYAVMLESDFWPHLITRTAARNIPIAFMSAQLSKRAFARWYKQREFAAHVFGCAEIILTHDKNQADQFRQLLRPLPKTHRGTIEALGSLKLPSPPKIHDKMRDKMRAGDKMLVASLRTAMCAGGRTAGRATGRAAGKNRLTILAASTHEPEENLILRVSERLKKNGHAHMLILAPRHPARGDQIAKLFKNPPRYSLGQMPSRHEEYYLCDVLGQMPGLLNCADLVILGGSFVPLGGHNPLEILPYQLPILAGPSCYKNKAEFDALKKIGMMNQVDNDDALYTQLVKLSVLHKQGRTPLTAKQKQQATAYVKAAHDRPKKAARLILNRIKT